MRKPPIIGMNSHGQAIVEMALVLFLLLLLVIGIFEFGRAMYIKNTLTHAARAGARAAVVTPNISNGSAVPDPNCNYGTNPTGNNRVYQAVCKSLYGGIKKNSVVMNIEISDIAAPTGLSTGDMVKVGIVLNNFKAVVPFIPIPNTLSGETAMRYE